MISRSDLIDVPERRSVPITEFEVRESGGTAHVEGYASIFDKGYDILGGPEAGGWTEHVNRSAFKRTLSENPDVVVLENHTGGPLARTKSGTLALATDSTGLIPRFDLDLRDPQAKSVFIKLDRKDYDEMSFAFRVKAQTWSDNETVRGLDEVSLHKGDVSIVNYGANPYTSVGLRSAVKMLAARDDFSAGELAELRAMSEQVDKAMARLRDSRMDAPLTPGAHHADPGFLDKDGKPAKDGDGVPRYQIDDAAHVRDALGRFSQNKDEYTPDQQKQILDAIHAAAKKFGVEVEKNSLISIVRRALSPDGFEDGNDDDYQNDSLAQAIHDMCAAAGADCGDETQIPAEPYPSESNAMTNPDTEVSITHVGTERNPRFQVRYRGAEKDFDTMADAAVWLQTRSTPTGTWLDEFGAKNLHVSDVQPSKLYDGNLTVADAIRMCRPEDSPNPLSLDAAEQLAS
jgi:HK97 family phage prohead protease